MMVWKMYLLSNMAILGSYVRFQGCIHPKVEWDLTNRPHKVGIELLDTQVFSGSVFPVGLGDFLEICWLEIHLVI